MVCSIATLFKKLRLETHENLGWGKIHLPEIELHTTVVLGGPGRRVRRLAARRARRRRSAGAGRAMQTVASVLLMADPHDIGMVAQVRSPHAEQAGRSTCTTPCPAAWARRAAVRAARRAGRRGARAGRGVRLRGGLPGVRRAARRGQRPSQGGRASPACGCSPERRSTRRRRRDKLAGTIQARGSAHMAARRRLVLARRLDRLQRRDRRKRVRAGPAAQAGSRRSDLARDARTAAPWAARRGTIVQCDHRVRISVDRSRARRAALRRAGRSHRCSASTSRRPAWPRPPARSPSWSASAWWAATASRSRQLLLPDHADESALLDLICAALPPDAWLVTYNGRCFDWPLMVARYRLHRRGPPPLSGHLDLLPVARQLWKHRLGSARLAVGRECRSAASRAWPTCPAPSFRIATSATCAHATPACFVDVVDHNRQDIISLGLLVGDAGRRGSRLPWNEHASRRPVRARPGLCAPRARVEMRCECVEAALSPRAWAASAACDGGPAAPACGGAGSAAGASRPTRGGDRGVARDRAARRSRCGRRLAARRPLPRTRRARLCTQQLAACHEAAASRAAPARGVDP